MPNQGLRGSDEACTLCPAGRTTERTGRVERNSADACSVCPAGTRATPDRTCEECPSGRFSAAPESTECTACRSACAPGAEFEAQPCGAGSTADRGCAACAVCAAGQFAASACSAAHNARCATCTQCTAGASYALRDCAPGSDRVCAECSTCGANELELAPCDTAHDRKSAALSRLARLRVSVSLTISLRHHSGQCEAPASAPQAAPPAADDCGVQAFGLLTTENCPQPRPPATVPTDCPAECSTALDDWTASWSVTHSELDPSKMKKVVG